MKNNISLNKYKILIKTSQYQHPVNFLKNETVHRSPFNLFSLALKHKYNINFNKCKILIKVLQYTNSVNFF